MPAAQLAGAFIESAINKLLSLDPASQKRLIALNGKQLVVAVKELPWPLTFIFNDKISLLMTAAEQPDCRIALSLSTLNKLKDTSQLTRLIQERELELIGDIHVAQSFSVLLNELDIDWEEQLSVYTGDVVAHQTIYGAKQLVARFKEHGQQLQQGLSDALIQEKQLIAHPMAIEQFSQAVNQLRSDTERLDARLKRLSQKQQG
ncbi:ubiquinone biosynthesis accessory factor UbiJ [Neptunicella marina]|uniref:Ubiquinone biosynthesis accessory factor UbiJ n=1 Tax=Neptunicella marina TaxID=2125989 RepID=A0A8J6IVC2_9ALTE|nr:SCP2 sterol-binding domain-containing protein [Neptunicella marina]MBC3766577.1 SCP2 sterol-binding domain-containing protein [Neptunicella marina]